MLDLLKVLWNSDVGILHDEMDVTSVRGKGDMKGVSRKGDVHFDGSIP